MDNQLEIPGTNPPCETGDLDHSDPTPLAIGEFLYGDDWVWMCRACHDAVWLSSVYPRPVCPIGPHECCVDCNHA